MQKEYEKLQSFFKVVELTIHCLLCLSILLQLLIVPFVRVYKGINDANYINVVLVLICLAYATYYLRFPYNTLIMSAGHFRKQSSAIIEALINIVVSILVWKFGLIG